MEVMGSASSGCDDAPSLLDMPLEVLEGFAAHLTTRDRFRLACSCKELWQRAAGSAAFWRCLALSTPSRSHAQQFLAWALPRRHLLQQLTIWEPFQSPGAGITAANFAMLHALGARKQEGGACALQTIIWNLTATSNLSLAPSPHLPHLSSLELDWMDVHDITATVVLPPGFAAALPALTRLALSNAAAVRMAPASLPPSLRMLSFENVPCAALVPTVAAALGPGGALATLHIRNLERRGVTLSLAGVERLAPSLISLQLHHPYQPDPLPRLAALTGLEDLDVSHANMAGSTLGEGLRWLTRLSRLSLQACALQAFPGALWALPRLQALDLSENYLHNGLPGAAAAAAVLTSLSLDLQYASQGGMQLGRLPPALRTLTLIWKAADLPTRLCSTLPWLRGLAGLTRLQFLPTGGWPPPNVALRDFPGVMFELEELGAAKPHLSISLSRY